MPKFKPKKRFIHANRSQFLLIPPDLNEWVGEGHIARFLAEVLEQLDFTKFYRAYKNSEFETAGRPAFAPELMVGLLFYGITRGALSSRSLEELSYSDLGARFLTGNHQPDHACIARFRLRHQEALQDVFAQVVFLCHKAGLVSLRHVSLDSKNCSGNVGSRSAKRVDQLGELLQQSEAKAQELLEKLQQADKDDEDAQARLKRQHGEAAGYRDRIQSAIEFLRNKQVAEGEPTEPPVQVEQLEEPRTRESIGKTIRDARQAKNHSMLEFATRLGLRRSRLSELENGRRPVSPRVAGLLSEQLGIPTEEFQVPKKPPKGRRAKVATLNITDHDCYLTYKPSDGYKRGYVCQMAVDSENQFIIHGEVSTKNTDQEYPTSFLASCRKQFEGKLPERASSDTNYTSVANIRAFEEAGIDYYTAVSPKTGTSETSATELVNMRAKLDSPEGKTIYDQRSAIVEPVMAWLGSQLGFRRFLYRGHQKVTSEWMQMLTGLNLIKWFNLLGKR